MPAVSRISRAGPNISGSASRQAFHVSAMMPSFDQNPPMSGMPIIDMDPNIIAVAVTGIFDASPPMLRMSWWSKSS